MTERQMLLNALRDVLLPELVERGFTALPLAGDDARSREIRIAFPFGRYRRPHAQGFEQVEIQIDKHRPAFRLNAALVPRDGIDHVAGHVACEDVWVHYMDRFAELYRSAAFRTWLALPRWRGGPAEASAYEQLARRAAALLPELEQAIGGGDGGGWSPWSHVRRVRA